MKISAYRWEDSVRNKVFSFIKLESTLDPETLTGILSRDLVLCNRINSGDIIIHLMADVSKVIIPIESASHPESDYGFGNVLFDVAMREAGE